MTVIGGRGVFFMFAALSCVGLIYMIKRVPETEDLSLSEIQVQIEGSDPSALKAVATNG